MTLKAICLSVSRSIIWQCLCIQFYSTLDKLRIFFKTMLTNTRKRKLPSLNDRWDSTHTWGQKWPHGFVILQKYLKRKVAIYLYSRYSSNHSEQQQKNLSFYFVPEKYQRFGLVAKIGIWCVTCVCVCSALVLVFLIFHPRVPSY